MSKRFGTPGARILDPSMCDSQPLGACTIGAQLLFDRLILQADDQGRLQGCADAIRWRCLPRVSKVTAKHVSAWLAELAKQRLIFCYSDAGNELIQVADWWPHQAGMRRAYPSKWPAPEGWTDRPYGVPKDDRPGTRAGNPAEADRDGKLPRSAANCGETPACAYAGACANAGAGAGAEADPAHAKSSSASPDQSESTPHSQFVAFWTEAFQRITGTAYAFQHAKDAAHVTAILEFAGGNLELAKARALALLNSSDPYYRDKGIDLGVLSSNWNRLGSAGRVGTRGSQEKFGAAYRPFAPPDPGA